MAAWALGSTSNDSSLKQAYFAIFRASFDPFWLSFFKDRFSDKSVFLNVSLRYWSSIKTVLKSGFGQWSKAHIRKQAWALKNNTNQNQKSLWLEQLWGFPDLARKSKWCSTYTSHLISAVSSITHSLECILWYVSKQPLFEISLRPQLFLWLE